MPETKNATLYRMVLPDHTCPFGVRARQMLEANGFAIDDRLLTTREEVDAFEAEQGVARTTHSAGIHRRHSDRRQRRAGAFSGTVTLASPIAPPRRPMPHR